MTPFRFGSPDTALHGVFHAAEPGRASGAAVLLCNPFGQEAIRIHRLYRVLAEELAQAGIASLRFDYFGTGDSLGEDEEGHLDRWVEDLRQAHAELQRRSRAKRTVWVCARLSGVLAARASATLAEPPDKVGLWAPIVDGAAYLADVREAHRKAMAPLLGNKTEPQAGELLGFGLHPGFEAEVAALSVNEYTRLRTGEAMVLRHEPEPLSDALAQALADAGLPTVQLALPLTFDWTSEEALNTALVPKQALQALTSWIQDETACTKSP